MDAADLADRSEEIKQAYSLQNATDREINSAKYFKVKAM
jgi:hypothetical protein